MFTVKATYRGETRKISFPDHIWFPTYNDLCKQLYRVFPLNDSYHFSRLLFSPDAFSAARILIAMEVNSTADYDRSLQQFIGRSYSNGLLRFSIFDDTPHKEPNRASENPQSAHSYLDSSTPFDDSTDKRPAIPPKPAGMMESTPFQYISALSHTPSVSARSRASSIAMDIDSSTTNWSNACPTPHSVEHTKAEIKSLIDKLQKDLDISLSLLETSIPTAPGRRATSMRRPGGSHETLAHLFHDGSFPSMGPPTRRASQATLRRASQLPTPVVHNGVWCDSCMEVIVGVRHKCLDCPDYDLCTPCVSKGGPERHNPFHEFLELREPGRVIVHKVYGGEIERQPANASRTGAAAPQPPQPAPASHSALCDLCDSYINGDRYKCLDCPDYDTCGDCFLITPEQHPNHSFVKMATDDVFIRRGPSSIKAHYATCNSCSQLIHGVRYKCMHTDCPDYDLCVKCEALPISVHPENHPMLKMKTVDTIIPTVYRAVSSHYAVPSPYAESIAESMRKEQEELRSVTPKPHENELPRTPQPTLTHPDFEESGVRNPFSDPPVIAPIGALSSLASSFDATVDANRIGLRTPSPVQSPVAEQVANPFEVVERSSSEIPSFVEDLVTQAKFNASSVSQPTSPIPVTGALNSVLIEDKEALSPPPSDMQQEVPLAELISQTGSLIALAETREENAAPIPVPAPVTPSETLSAAFVSDVTVTDGQIFPPGAEFVKCWRMINDSTIDWPEGTELAFVAGESLVIDPSSEVVKVGAVQAGSEVDVWTGELKAPEVPGRYVGYWRLRDAGGSVFGNSIWVEINVAEPDHSSDSSLAASIIMMPSAAGSTTSAQAMSNRQPESTIGEGTATIPSTTDDGNSDIDNDSDVSLIDLVSSDDEDNFGWEDARSHATTGDRASHAGGANPAGASDTNARRSPSAAGTDYVLLFDDSSDSDF